MKLPRLQNFNLEGKTVLVRADLDVPLREQQSSSACRQSRAAEQQRWEVADDTRLRNCLPTIKYLLKKNCQVVLLGHLGRPGGKLDSNLSLRPVRESLTLLLNSNKVEFSKEILGESTEENLRRLREGEILLLENLRFNPEEEMNDLEFAKKLASLGDFYVNECFGTSHRKHASLVGIPEFLPHVAGLFLLKEVKNLSGVLQNPKKPVVIVIGGAKEDRLKLIPRFLKIADFILIGGWLLKRIPKARQLADDKKIFACLTKDGKDITVESAKRLGKIISRGGTVVWSGPMGVYEDKRDIKGTKIVAEAIANSSAFKIAGGGDTEAAIDTLGLKEKFDWISSGGGAMLQFLAEGTLPGIKALKN